MFALHPVGGEEPLEIFRPVNAIIKLVSSKDSSGDRVGNE